MLVFGLLGMWTCRWVLVFHGNIGTHLQVHAASQSRNARAMRQDMFITAASLCIAVNVRLVSRSDQL